MQASQEIAVNQAIKEKAVAEAGENQATEEKAVAKAGETQATEETAVVAEAGETQEIDGKAVADTKENRAIEEKAGTIIEEMAAVDAHVIAGGKVDLVVEGNAGYCRFLVFEAANFNGDR